LPYKRPYKRYQFCVATQALPLVQVPLPPLFDDGVALNNHHREKLPNSMLPVA
jgi:hypothetical protein